QLTSSADYNAVIIAYRNGAAVRLSDVATAIDGTENVRLAAWMNDTAAVIMNVQRQPGANIISVADRVKQLLPMLKSSLPSSVQVKILTDRTQTIRASVKDVQFELMLTIGLVVMVIFLFLRNLSATVIPSVAVPLSLVGTFGVMYLLGYSLNNLTLMALTISTGFVVDDAIVMIENITRYIDQGDDPLEAALKGSEQIGFTIMSLTVSLIAVLIPLLFMGDVVGRLFREFAVTLSVTILLSAVVSLTLTPMMCAKLLRHKQPSEQTRFYRASELAKVEGITLYLQPVQDLTVEDRVSRTQFQYSLEDADARELSVWVPKFVARLQSLPELRDVASDQQNGGLEARLILDRTTASRLGITPLDLDNSLYDAFGQRQVSTMFTQLNQYRVVLESQPSFQDHPDDLKSVYLRSTGGGSVPLASFTQVQTYNAPLAVNHQGQFPVVTVSFNLAPGASLGQAVKAIEKAKT